MNTHKIASRIARKIAQWLYGVDSMRNFTERSIAEIIATELDKELKPMEEERDKWKRLYDAECELNWTASLCDRLNSLVRENRKHFISECKGGPSACDLVTQIHGQFNLAQGDITQLRAQLAELKPALDRIEHETCGQCNYMRSIAAPCKCGQFSVKGTNDHLRAQLAEAQSVNKRVHDELLAEKEQVARMKSRHESNKAVVDGVWKQHEEQFEQLKTQLAEAQKERCEHCGSDRIYHGPPVCQMCGAPNCCQTCCKQTTLEIERDQLKAQLAEAQELLKAARAGQPLGPIIGAQTMLNQDSEIRHLKAQLASEQEKVRKAVQGLQKLTGYTFEIFHDGVGADLHDAGITTIEDAFMEGMQEATRELKGQAQATLRELEGDSTAPAPKT